MRYEQDLVRFFKTRERLKKRKENIDMQVGYCTKNFDDKTISLSEEQQKQIHEMWDKISFAYSVNSEWHQMYTSKTGIFSSAYIPNELHYYFVENKLINYEYLRAFTDKNYLGLLFHDIKQPQTVIRRIKGLYYKNNFENISLEDAARIVQDNLSKGIVIKPSIHSWGGRNISFFQSELSLDKIKRIFSDYGNNFIIQNVIKQHDALAAIHNESVNTIRIITILLNGEVNVLSACLRMGVGESQVDNFSQGGVGCGIQKNGRLNPFGYDRWGNRVDQHPSGYNFEDCTIPNFEEVVASVKRAAIRVPQFGVASWDFAVDEEGTPVLIEYNVSQGGIDIHQYNNGPLYGDKTDEILDYVFKNYCVEDTTIPYNYNVFNDHVTIKTGSKEMKYIHVKNSHHDLPVTRIGQEAFKDAAVKRIRLPRNLLYLDYCAFYNCKNLRKVKLPNGLLQIGRSAFNACTSLKVVKVPRSVNSIGVKAFRGIDNLTIYIPIQVSNIASNAFENCNNLRIVGTPGSYVEKFAKEHNLPFFSK